MKPLVLVVAVAKNGVIGKDGKLPWRIPEDLRHFSIASRGELGCGFTPYKHAALEDFNLYQFVGKEGFSRFLDKRLGYLAFPDGY